MNVVPSISSVCSVSWWLGAIFPVISMEFLKMERIPVLSSNLHSVGYDSERSVLEIKFHGGRIYQYSRVPIGMYQGLMTAASHGEYFHAFIRKVYPYRKVG
jgi:KTSC domain